VRRSSDERSRLPEIEFDNVRLSRRHRMQRASRGVLGLASGDPCPLRLPTSQRPSRVCRLGASPS
jgi:hypothetical protein